MYIAPADNDNQHNIDIVAARSKHTKAIDSVGHQVHPRLHYTVPRVHYILETKTSVFTHPMSHPLEYMTDLWPRLFTDMSVLCRVRAVSRALSAATLDFSAASMVIYGDKIENGTEIEIVNHRYCGKKCADSLMSGAEMTHCAAGCIIRITILYNIILVNCEQIRHVARESYDCTTIVAPRNVYADDKRSRLSWRKVKMLRYDVIIGDHHYRSNAPGAELDKILGSFMDIAMEYY